MTGRSVTTLVLALALAVATFGRAQALPVSGSLWDVPEPIAQDATLANIPGTAPDVTFLVNAPLDFNATSATVGAWLASGGAFNIVGSGSALARLMDDGSTGTLLRFAGLVTVTNGETFTVTHDDGLTLLIGGLDLGFNPGKTSPVTSLATYTGPSGNFPFQLVYAECCGGPAVLQVALPFEPTPVPEPSIPFLLGFGLAGLSGMVGWWQRTGRDGQNGR